jgi:mono/diheme cytochrome c family protein
MRLNRSGFAVLAVFVAFAPLAIANDVAPPFDVNLGMTPDPAKGFDIIIHSPMGTTVMKETDPQNLWKIWEPKERAAAEKATDDERRAMTWKRYGWADRPDAKEHWIPLDYTPDGKGSLVTNCFACHGGQVMGKTVPGVGNTLFDLTTIATDIQRLRALESGGDPSKVQDTLAPFKTPLNQHRGVSNAVIFAHVFAGLRNREVFAKLTANPELLQHHDMNAPAWWLYQKKDRIYADGFAPKTPRQLMPFAMSPIYTDEQFKSFEPNFVHIQAYINSLKPPKYPFEIDYDLAAKGKLAFEETCKKCHGTYGENWTFPNKKVPIDEIGTDPIRRTAVPEDRREYSNEGWLQYNGEHPLDLKSEGYMGQRLDGIWASAPYLHNGSVPSLYHLFNVDERPVVWKRDEYGYDEQNVGLKIEEFDAVPSGLNSRETRMYYNTANKGNSAAGHTFPDDELTAEEKVAVIEYLKTL